MDESIIEDMNEDLDNAPIQIDDFSSECSSELQHVEHESINLGKYLDTYKQD